MASLNDQYQDINELLEELYKNIDVIQGIVIGNNNELYIIVQDKPEIFYILVTKDIVHIFFPNITKLYDHKDMKIKKYIMRVDHKICIELTEELGKLLKIDPDQLKFIDIITQDNDYHNIVEKAGLENKYCLLFGNKIIEHFNTKEEMERICNNSNIRFLRYCPYSKQ